MNSEIICSGSVKCFKTDWMMLHSEDNGLNHTVKLTHNLLKAKEFNVLQSPSYSSDLNTIKPVFHLLKVKLKAKYPKNKQEVTVQ